APDLSRVGVEGSERDQLEDVLWLILARRLLQQFAEQHPTPVDPLEPAVGPLANLGRKPKLLYIQIRKVPFSDLDHLSGHFPFRLKEPRHQMIEPEHPRNDRRVE